MTHEDKIQRAAFFEVSDPKRSDHHDLILEIESMSAFQIEVPAVLESYLRQMMDKHQIDPQYNHTHTTSCGRTVTLSLDHTIDDNQYKFQLELIQNGVPMSIYLNNDDDHWKRNEFRWIDSTYVVYETDFTSGYLDLMTVLHAFEKDKLDELKETALNQEILTRPIPFYEEDIAFCKPMALKAICGGV